MSRQRDEEGNLIYCSGSGRLAGGAKKWNRCPCAVCGMPDVLVNANGRLRKHLPRGHSASAEGVQRGSP
jgi:hypothetical protein